MNINLEYYKVFYYVQKSGSLTAAAEALCISQPAVSQAIKQLETSLGAKLFVRTAKGVKLTREGEILSAYVSRGIENLEKGETMVRRFINLETGEVRIGASDMTLQFFLLPYLEKFHQKYPGVKVNVSNGPTPETIQALEAGNIDFAVVSTPFQMDKGLEAVEVKQIENIFIAGSQLKHLQKKRLSYKILLDYPCVFLEKNTSTRAFMDQFLEQQEVFPEPEFELATSDMVVQFVRRNLGIGCVMSGFAEEALKKEKVFPLKFEKEMPKRYFSIVTGDRKLISAPASCLLSMIQSDT